MSEKIKVIIVSGFLGSGKTTFINKFIKQNQAIKPAIIENEVGETSIDTLILKSEENIFEIFNGCVCCSVQNELLDVLNELIIVKHKFNYLIIETTGIADPGSVITPFYSEEYKTFFELKSVVTIIDALNFLSRFNSEIELQKQIIAADVLYLNKSDLVTENKVLEIRRILKELNTEADVLIDFNQENLKNSVLENKRESLLQPQFQRFQNYTSHKHSHIQVFSFTTDGEISKEKFNYWLPYFLSLNSQRIFRIKALLYFSTSEKKILQTVGNAHELVDFEYSFDGEKKENKWVFIGKNFDENEIKEAVNYLYEE